ncbi:MAG TPA: hypothetical protein VGE34_04155 [Candidatus Saccharimonadales bacterium]
MLKTIKNAKSLMVVAALALVVSLVPAAMTSALGIQGGAKSAQGEDQTDCLVDDGGNTCTDTPIFKTITDVMLFLVGAISVIMLIIGGIRYTVSGGDSSAVQSAKNTILYAIVGIIVSLLAYAVVTFVVGNFVK